MERPPFVYYSLLRLGLALALGVQRDELADVLHDLDAKGPPAAVFLTDDAEARAWAAVALGDVALARTTLWAGVDAGLRVDDLVGVASLLHGIARLGDAKRAAPHLTEVAASIDGRLAAGRAAHAEALVGRDPERLQLASTAFEAMGAVLLAAEAAADAAVAWEKAGAKRQRSAAQARAIALATRCEGASTPALQAIDCRAHLTPAELETAMLASAGRSDRQIADDLHLSVRTVENRLHRVYVKLGIARRDELVAALGAAPRAPGD
jgi:DNA-binding CsgD family transcriptional regulator